MRNSRIKEYNSRRVTNHQKTCNHVRAISGFTLSHRGHLPLGLGLPGSFVSLGPFSASLER